MGGPGSTGSAEVVVNTAVSVHLPKSLPGLTKTRLPQCPPKYLRCLPLFIQDTTTPKHTTLQPHL